MQQQQNRGGGYPEPEPKPETTISKIEIAVSDLTSSSANVSYAPSVDYLGYFPSIIEKSDFDKFADDAACIKDVIDFLKASASSQSKPLEEIIDTYTKKGNQSHVFDDLSTGEEYVAYAVGVNRDGTPSSILFKKNFTIPVPGPSDNTISIDVTQIGIDGAILSTSTTNQDPYILDVWEASKFEGLTDEQIMDKVLGGYGAGFWDDNLIHGDDTLNVQGRLEPETDYIAVAFGYEAGVKTTALVKEPFATKPGGWVNCTFSISEITLNSRSASYKVTPSDTTVPYYFSLIEASKIADGSDETALTQLQEVIEEKFNEGWDYALLLFRGEKAEEYKELLPKTDYYLCVVGMNTKGEIITDFAKQKITTPDASSATVVFGTPQISGREVTVSVAPGANTARWKAICIYTKYSFYTEEYMTTHMLDLVVTEGQTSVTSKVPDEETKAYFYGIGYDADGNPGKLVYLEVPLP